MFVFATQSLKNTAKHHDHQTTHNFMQILDYAVFKYLGLPSLYSRLTH